MFYRNQSFFIAGLSKSGIAAADFLLRRGAKVVLYDDVKTGDTKSVEELCKRGAVRVDEPSEDCDVLVLSPGIPIDHPVPVSYKKQGKRIVGESELATSILRATSVAVTGTNGKTTTVSLIGEICKNTYSTHLCGNIGVPMISCAETLSFDDLAVVEISSFQLETLRSFMPHIVVVTNVTEDHLDRHYTMDNYLFLKKKMLRNCTESEFAVLNYDDENVRAFAEETRAKVVWFSLYREVDGAFLSDRVLKFRDETILSADELCLSGKHNLLNALASIAVAKLLNVPNEEIVRGLTSFKGIKHRNELVKEVDGVKYINDSKGTNVDATIKAIENLPGEIVLMLGGKDKGYDYDKLFSFIKRSGVVHCVLYGENKMKLVRSAVKEDYTEVTVCSGFELAFSLAHSIARKGQSVLLSPASASFDEFSCYEERGDKFVSLVEAL